MLHSFSSSSRAQKGGPNKVLFKKGVAPILLREITEIPGLGWGRRSLYQLRGHPILISEFFLPELLDQMK
jgi:chorismate--pyruvate lyase